MPSAELAQIARRLRASRAPEEVFGPLEGDLAARRDALRRCYRRLSRATHPDRFADPADRALATETFARLTSWREMAEAWLARGGAAPVTGPATVRLGRRTYRVGAVLAEGDLTTLFQCMTDDGPPIVLKLARDATDNDLLANEAVALATLAASPALDGYRPYVPTLLGAIDNADGDRAALLLPWFDGFVSLRQVRAAYPAGLPPEQMGWIWRRLLVALTVTHRAGLVHGAVLPEHILIHPIDRGLVLIDWSYAVLPGTGAAIGAISTPYEAWYPGEVWRREPAIPATDLFLAARCMIDLLGGDPLTGHLPASVPARLRLFLTGTARPHAAQRPQQAGPLLADFDALLTPLFGGRHYQPLHLPRPEAPHATP
jgi:hypothetical protein